MLLDQVHIATVSGGAEAGLDQATNSHTFHCEIQN